jgi:hypothetical protein
MSYGSPARSTCPRRGASRFAEESRYTLPGFGDDEEDADSQPDTQVDTECVEPADEYS